MNSYQTGSYEFGCDCKDHFFGKTCELTDCSRKYNRYKGEFVKKSNVKKATRVCKLNYLLDSQLWKLTDGVLQNKNEIWVSKETWVFKNKTTMTATTTTTTPATPATSTTSTTPATPATPETSETPATPENTENTATPTTPTTTTPFITTTTESIVTPSTSEKTSKSTTPEKTTTPIVGTPVGKYSIIVKKTIAHFKIELITTHLLQVCFTLKTLIKLRFGELQMMIKSF